MLLKPTCENIITESIAEVKNLSFFESVNDFQKIGKSPSQNSKMGSFTESNSKASLESNGSQVLEIPESCLAIVSEKMKMVFVVLVCIWVWLVWVFVGLVLSWFRYTPFQIIPLTVAQ